VREWLTSPVEEYDACIGWPSPRRDDPPIRTEPPLVPRSLPVLVLSGGLDSLTPWVGGRRVARQMGPSARWVKVENTIHVTALYDPFNCANKLVRQFVQDPGRLRKLDASCAARIPELRAVGTFPRRLADATPAAPAPGNATNGRGLRLAAVAAATVGDAIARWNYIPDVNGVGLRGGSFTATGDPLVSFRLRGARFTADTAVDGTATWDTASGRVRAVVTIRGPDKTVATLRLAWNDHARHAVATVTGSAGRTRVAARLPAP